MKKLVLRLYDSLSAHRRTVVPLMLVCFILLSMAVTRMKPREDITAFLPEDGNYERVAYAYSNLGAANNVVVTVSPLEGADSYVLMDAADSLESYIARNNGEGHVKSVTKGPDISRIKSVSDFLADNMPLYLEKDDYARMEASVCADSVSAAIRRVSSSLYSFTGQLFSDMLMRDPMMFSSRILSSLNYMKQDTALEDEDGYFFDKEGNLVMFVESAYPVGESMGNKMLIALLDSGCRHVESAVPGCSVKPFGAAYISVANADTVKRDTLISVSVALFLLLFVLLYAYGSIKPVLLLLLSLFAGALTGLAAVSLITPEVSLIALGIGSVLIGIAANYPLHYIDHISDGHSPRKSISDIFLPLTVGNVTTVGAFLSLLFISSPAMRNLGIFASAVLVGTMLFVLVFLPHLAGRINVSRRDFIHGSGMGHGVAGGWAVLAVFALTLVLYSFSAGGTHFNGNLSEINYMPDGYREKMRVLLEQSQAGKSKVYAVAESSSADGALEAYMDIMPVVDSVASLFPGAEVSGPGKMLPPLSVQEERISMWNAFVDRYGDRLVSLVDSCAAAEGFVQGAFDGFRQLVEKDYFPMDISGFAPVVDGMASNYLVTGERNMVVSVVSIPEEYVQPFEEKMSACVDAEKAFVFDDGSLIRGLVSALERDFDKVLYICSFLVFAFLLLSFGRLELAIAAFLPLFVGWIWILGIMEICGLDFNIVNVILATFIFGMGDDYTIFMLEGAMYEYVYGRKMLDRYRNTIALSALTMFIGIGALILAEHPAMQSLAKVTMIGMGVVVFMAYLIPPVIFRFLTCRKGVKRRFPVTLMSLLRTGAVILYAACSLVVIFLYGVVRVDLLRGGVSARRKYVRLISRMMRFAATHFFGVSCEYASRYDEDFSRPCVVICNHQSKLDLMVAVALSDRLSIVANDFSWMAYRWVIARAGYVRASTMLENDMAVIRRRVSEGRSIFIFPEGTRSRDNSIGRFHKGAFMIAGQLGLDVVEVLVHGTSALLPKGSFSIEKAPFRCEIVRRISHSDLFPDGVTDDSVKAVTRKMRAMMAEDYGELSRRQEDFRFMKREVLANFRYSGREISASVKRSLGDDNELSAYMDRLGPAVVGGALSLSDSGYGERSLLAALVMKDVKIRSYIPDRDRFDVASSLASVPGNLEFVNQEYGGGRDITVLGGGMSGLVSAALLAKDGYKVTVLEKERNLGGGLASFMRKGVVFDAGVHTLFGFGEEGAFGMVCRRLGIYDMLGISPVCSADGKNIFGRVYAGGRLYDLHCGKASFVRYFSELFPSEASGVSAFVDSMYEAAEKVPVLGGRRPSLEDAVSICSSRESYYDVLCRYVSDPDLRMALSWLTVYSGLSADKVPFVLGALISRLFIDESCTVEGGVTALRKELVNVIEDNGGVILCGNEVSSLILDGNRLSSALCSNGKSFSSSLFLSSIPLENMICMLRGESSGGRNPLSRISSKLNSRKGRSSLFSMCVKMKPGTDRNMFAGVPEIHVGGAEWPHTYVIVPYVCGDELQSVQIHCRISYDRFAEWEGSVSGRRPQGYYDFKRELESEVVDDICLTAPEFADMISEIWSSSPLTVRDYLGRSCGDVYGRLAVASDGIPMIPVSTPVENLYLTGQDILFHGLCGVPATCLSAVEAIGRRYGLFQ